VIVKSLVSKWPQEELEEDHARQLKALVQMAGEVLAGTLKNEAAESKTSFDLSV
jgi:hypothetical protein